MFGLNVKRFIHANIFIIGNESKLFVTHDVVFIDDSFLAITKKIVDVRLHPPLFALSNVFYHIKSVKELYAT